jgi:hypothetical protein
LNETHAIKGWFFAISQQQLTDIEKGSHTQYRLKVQNNWNTRRE